VFEIGREDQYAKVGMAHRKGHGEESKMGAGAGASSTLVVDESPLHEK